MSTERPYAPPPESDEAGGDTLITNLDAEVELDFDDSDMLRGRRPKFLDDDYWDDDEFEDDEDEAYL